jgi:hypothetical protein
MRECKLSYKKEREKRRQEEKKETPAADRPMTLPAF